VKRRAERAYEGYQNEEPEKDKVDPSFWKGMYLAQVLGEKRKLNTNGFPA